MLRTGERFGIEGLWGTPDSVRLVCEGAFEQLSQIGGFEWLQIEDPRAGQQGGVHGKRRVLRGRAD